MKEHSPSSHSEASDSIYALQDQHVIPKNKWADQISKLASHLTGLPSTFPEGHNNLVIKDRPCVENKYSDAPDFYWAWQKRSTGGFTLLPRILNEDATIINNLMTLAGMGVHFSPTQSDSLVIAIFAVAKHLKMAFYNGGNVDLTKLQQEIIAEQSLDSCWS